MLLGQRVDREHFRLYRPEEYGFLKPKAHGRILAITFTNKATQEMTVRIIKELSLLANPGKRKSPYLKDLLKLFRTTEQELAASARRALADLLFNYSWFNVSTIDSFFQNVLHIFTRELDLPESFSLEISDTYPVAAAVGQMLSSINLPPRNQDRETATHIRHLKSWLKNYMETLLDSGTDSNLLARSSRLNSYLIGTISRLRGETFKANSKRILDYLSDPERPGRFVRALNEAQRHLRDRIVDASASFLDLEESTLLPKLLREDYLERWASGDFSYTPLGRDTLPKALQPEGKRHNAPKKGLKWTEDIDAVLLRILEAGMKYFLNERFYSILRRQIYLLGLFSEACRHIDEYCRENEAFLLGDTNSLLRKVICEIEAPFVYERIGYTISHFLIDEFQDTSEMQWANLSPLVMESMSRGKDNLIIGDEKQCIYRFRNSNPELLGHKVQTNVSERFGEADITVRGTAIEDNTNWRSAPQIVKFNNSLFKILAEVVDESIGASTITRQTYSGIIQQVAEKNRDLPGYVKVLIGPERPFSPEQRELVQGEAAEEPYETWTQDDILRKMAQEINRQLSAGYSPGDIAVLVYTHQQGEAVISYLLDFMRSEEWGHGHVEIMSSDALEISASPAVQLIIGLLRLMTTPQYVLDKDNPSIEGKENLVPNPEFLRNRLIHRFELSVFDQTEILDEEGNPMLDAKGEPQLRRLTPQEALRKAILATTPLPGEENQDPLQIRLDSETSKIGEMDCPSLFAITERIIRKYLPEESRRSEAAFLSAFQDLVLEFTERGESDAETFLKWWDSRGKYETLPAPDGMEAISVMTIHQSKGLEYDCVHIPFTSKTLVRYAGEEWYKLDPHGFPGVDPEDVPPFIPLVHSKTYMDIPMLTSQIQRYTIQQKVDNLNVAYVAFTRAVRELTVYVSPSGNGEHLGKMLVESFLRLNSSAIGEFNLSGDELDWVMPLAPLVTELPRGERIIEIGAPTSPLCIIDPETPAEEVLCEGSPLTVTPPSLPSFDAEIPYETVLSEYQTVRPAEMTLPADVEQQGVFDITDERHVGNFLHDALANVNTIGDLPRAMERAAYARALRPQQWRPYLMQLQNALSAPQVLPWFRDYQRVATERPLTAPDGVRRPDRIVWMPDGTIAVIDYKFGQPRRKYRDQVRNYMGLLSQCGFTNLRGYLLFPLAVAPAPLVIPVD